MELKHTEEVLSMLSAFTGDHRYEKVYEEHLKEKAEKGEKIAMCNGIQYWEDKGAHEERMAAIRNMIKYGVPKDQILQDYSEEEYERARNSQLVP